MKKLMVLFFLVALLVGFVACDNDNDGVADITGPTSLPDPSDSDDSGYYTGPFSEPELVTNIDDPYYIQDPRYEFYPPIPVRGISEIWEYDPVVAYQPLKNDISECPVPYNRTWNKSGYRICRDNGVDKFGCGMFFAYIDNLDTPRCVHRGRLNGLP